MSDDINKMDFKQLRNEVQLLRDELAIMQRKYEDILYNLDDDNFSVKTLKEKETMKESIIETGNSVSSIKQTADSIQSTVTSVFTEIEQIDSLSELNSKPKNKIYSLDGVNYHYNHIINLWEEIDGNSIASSFIQTADGFELNGDVAINGDAIVSGTISADRVDAENLSCTRLYAKGYANGYYAKMTSSVGDFGVYRSNASIYASPLDDTCVFGAANSDGGINEVVNFYVYGENFMGYNAEQSTTWAKGSWDFSVANVEGLEDSGYATKAWVLSQLSS